MADKVSHHGPMTSVHAESKLAHSGKPKDTAVGWRNNTSNGTTAAIKHVGGTDLKHQAMAGGKLLRGLSSR